MEIASVIEDVFRQERARVLAALVGSVGDFELAEDALQDAAISRFTTLETYHRRT